MKGGGGGVPEGWVMKGGGGGLPEHIVLPKHLCHRLSAFLRDRIEV
jgi:hypothetical protein